MTLQYMCQECGTCYVLEIVSCFAHGTPDLCPWCGGAVLVCKSADSFGHAACFKHFPHELCVLAYTRWNHSMPLRREYRLFINYLLALIMGVESPTEVTP